MLKHRFVRGVRIEPGAPHPEKAYFSYMTGRGRESDVQFPVADGVGNGRCHLDGEVRADSTSADNSGQLRVCSIAVVHHKYSGRLPFVRMLDVCSF